MKYGRILWFLPILVLALFALRSGKNMALAASAQKSQRPPAPHIVDLKAPDGIVLKATYFAAGTPGPGAILYHQSNRTRESWEQVALQLAAAGINTLTLDDRGYGESGGTHEGSWEKKPGDLETAFQFLTSQPGVQRDVIGLAGAGSHGVVNEVEMARKHPSDVKSLVLMSGETFRPGIEFLHEASQLPELFVVADMDEYPPTVEAMLWLYARASSPMRKLIHYSAAQEAPWLWYESYDASKVAATGDHGTDLFREHPDLPGIIVQWFVTTLIKTPGHAPADPLAASAILNQLATPGEVAQVKQQLIEARKKDLTAQLWPEVSGDIIGSGHLREGEVKEAIEVFQLNLLAYPDSADAHFNLADAYQNAGQKDLARQYAEKALAMIDSHAGPLSSWSNTEPRRAEIRNGVEDLLKKLNAPAATTSGRAPGSLFRDCPDCPEMVVIPGGNFTMGSSSTEKSWAASQVGSAEGVADESPQHNVSLPSFAMGKYDVTRAEYATFVRETERSAGDGCGRDGFEWKKQADKSWQNPGFNQTDRDPVVCVSWQDAKAYIAWLNGKVQQKSSASGEGPYRLPSESEWEYAARAGTGTRFWWGDDDAATSDHAWYKGNSGGRTHPVGLKSANAFGLYDMVGNVWQWTEDCYAESYFGAPTDGRANEIGVSDPRSNGTKECMRVDRGGALTFRTWALRPATRERNPADYRDTIMGFRLARTLP